VLNRRTVALQRRAIIGWTFEQSMLQRWGDRMSVGVATAAGDRYYTAPDAGVQQALALAAAATPELAQRFIEADGNASRDVDNGVRELGPRHPAV
jgi:putative membrane protein